MSARSQDKNADVIQPSPLYFIVRPELKRLTPNSAKSEPGPLVPLIAVDELPNWCEIIGVPRELKVEQTIGLYNLGTVAKHGVYNVGVVPNSDYPYTLKDASNDQGSANGGHDSHESRIVNKDQGTHQPAGLASSRHNFQPEAASINGSIDNAKCSLVPGTGHLSDYHPADRMKTHWQPSHGKIYDAKASPTILGQQHLKIARPSRGSSPPLSDSSSTSTTSTGLAPTLGSSPLHENRDNNGTDYCRHWCRYGSCKWGLYCRYTHNMPSTYEDLAKVGLKDIPAWWTAAMNMMLAGGQHAMDPVGALGSYDMRLAAHMGMMGFGGKKTMRRGGWHLPMAACMNPGLPSYAINRVIPVGVPLRTGREMTPMDRRGIKTKPREVVPGVMPMMVDEGEAARPRFMMQRAQHSRAAEEVVEEKGHIRTEELLPPPAGHDAPDTWAERMEKAVNEKRLIDI